MSTATGLTITKVFTYRGDTTEEFSNKYWLTGPPPSSDQAWSDLFQEIAVVERAVYPSSVLIVRATGYNDNDPHAHAVWTEELTGGGQIPGSYAPGTSDIPTAGDQAGMVEWRTARKNSRGKWIYLRKYFHAAHVSHLNVDDLSDGQSIVYNAYATKMSDGTLSAGRKIRSQKQDEVIEEHRVSPYITTRTLKRRGKRP